MNPASAAGLLAGLLVAAAVVVVLPPGPRSLRRRLGPSPAAASPLRPRSAGRADPPGGAVPLAVVADLVAALLWSGLPPGAALDVVRRAAAELGLAAPTGLDPVLEAIVLAEATGLAPAGLVRSAAQEHRRRQAAAADLAARRLAVLVVLPMGLLLLPAFVLLTVAPLVLGLLGR